MKNSKKEITAKDVQNGANYFEYNAQFVTPALKAYVEREIGLKKILACTSRHFNEVPLAKWDALSGVRNCIDAAQWKRLHNTTYPAANANDFMWSPSCTVSLAKAAARQIRIEHAVSFVGRLIKVEYIEVESRTRGYFETRINGTIDQVLDHYESDWNKPFNIGRNGEDLFVVTFDITFSKIGM